MRSKKGITMTSVMIALALGLLLLAVLSTLSGKSFASFFKSISDCEGKNGICLEEAACKAQDGTYESFYKCEKEKTVCCFLDEEGKENIKEDEAKK